MDMMASEAQRPGLLQLVVDKVVGHLLNAAAQHRVPLLFDRDCDKLKTSNLK